MRHAAQYPDTAMGGSTASTEQDAMSVLWCPQPDRGCGVLRRQHSVSGVVQDVYLSACNAMCTPRWEGATCQKPASSVIAVRNGGEGGVQV